MKPLPLLIQKENSLQEEEEEEETAAAVSALSSKPLFYFFLYLSISSDGTHFQGFPLLYLQEAFIYLKMNLVSPVKVREK